MKISRQNEKTQKFLAREIDKIYIFHILFIEGKNGLLISNSGILKKSEPSPFLHFLEEGFLKKVLRYL